MAFIMEYFSYQTMVTKAKDLYTSYGYIYIMRKILTITGLVGLLGVSGCSKEGVEHRVDPQSPFANECVALNLNPQSTSGYQLYAAKLGLPLTATPDQIIENKHGFNPSKLSSDELQLRLGRLGYTEVQDLYTHLLD